MVQKLISQSGILSRRKAEVLILEEKVLINGKYKSLEGYIVFYASRDIEKGEELCYYYGDAYYKLFNKSKVLL